MVCREGLGVFNPCLFIEDLSWECYGSNYCSSPLCHGNLFEDSLGVAASGD